MAEEKYDLSSILKQGRSALQDIKKDVEDKEQASFMADQKAEMERLERTRKAGNSKPDGKEPETAPLSDEEYARQLQAEEEALAQQAQIEEVADAGVRAALLEALGREGEADEEADRLGGGPEEARLQQLLWESMNGSQPNQEVDGKAEAKTGDGGKQDVEEKEEDKENPSLELADGKEDTPEEEDAALAKALAATLAQEEEDQGRRLAAKLQRQEARASHREAAKEKIMSQVNEEKSSLDWSNEAEQLAFNVRIWKNPRTEFTEVIDGFQIAVYLPHLIKLNVPLDEEKKGLYVMAERLPLAYADGVRPPPDRGAENPITCQTMLHVRVGKTPGLLSSKHVSFEYIGDDQMLYINIVHAGISKLSIDKKQDIFQGMKGGIKRIFNFRGGKGSPQKSKK